MRSHMNKKILAVSAVALVAAACKDSTGVPDLNNPSVTSLGALNKASLVGLVRGVVDQERRAINDYPFLVFPGTLARDYLRLDPSEGGFETELLQGQPLPGSFSGGRGFAPFYVAIRAENNLLAALSGAVSSTVDPVNGLSAGDKSATAGFIKTLKANDFYRVLANRDTTGLPVAVDNPDVLAPILCKPQVLNYLSSLLDSAYTDLQAAQTAGTTALPVSLPSGFTSTGGDYSKVANLIKYNRGLKGKIDVYRGLQGNAAAFTSAITALNIALTGVAQDAPGLAGGPYFQFSTASGEVTNPNFDSKIVYQPSVFDSLQPGDLRISKITTLKDATGKPKAQTLNVGNYLFASAYVPTVSVTSNAANQTRPIPILKNEELFLLRAQAEIGANLLAAATTDLNVVRTVSGGLAPYAVFTSQATAIDALLYEKRYSLLNDGPQRLVDLRAYGRLNKTTFPAGGTPRSQLSPFEGDPFNFNFPLNQAEIDARKGNIACVAS
jgi:starch-binding outer membrane protein, SusD/RagB family